MRHEHEWYASGKCIFQLCRHCGVQADGKASIDCPGPKPAGNTGRHTSHVETLQAAAYGAILEPGWLARDIQRAADRVKEWSATPKPCGCMTLSCPHEPDPLKLGEALPIAAAPARSQRGESEGWSVESHLDAKQDVVHKATGALVRSLCRPIQRHGRASWDIPISFDRRLGWKPGDCE